MAFFGGTLRADGSREDHSKQWNNSVQRHRVPILKHLTPVSAPAYGNEWWPVCLGIAQS